MATVVVSYSRTENNDRVAAQLSRKLGARQVRLTEDKPKTVGSIALDMLFQRTPAVQADLSNVGTGDFVVFVGPVWMGRPASTLRKSFRTLAPRLESYAFVSVCGGAGANPKLADDLARRLGKHPVLLKELPLATLLPSEPKPTPAMTSAYRITDEQAESFAESLLPSLRKVLKRA